MFFIITGGIFVIYFLCIALFTGHGTNFYFIWLLAGILLLALGSGMRKGLFSHIPLWLRRACLIILCAGGLVFLFVEGCIISGFAAKGTDNLDVIIVLGAQMKADGPSRVLKMRLDKAYDYLESNPNTLVIVSGGQGRDEHVSEAQGMYDYLTQKGIGPERIIMEDKSRNTKENISLSSEYLDMENDTVGIVSNNFHIFRATHIAQKYGYEKVYGIAAPSEFFLQFNNMLREFFGVVKDFAVGNI